MKLAQQTISSLLNTISYLEEAIQHYSLLCEQRFVQNRTNEIQEEINLLEKKKLKILENAAKAPSVLAKMKPELEKAKDLLQQLKEEKEERKLGVPRKLKPKALDEKLEALYSKMPLSVQNNFLSKEEAILFLKELV